MTGRLLSGFGRKKSGVLVFLNGKREHRFAVLDSIFDVFYLVGSSSQGGGGISRFKLFMR
jgi:hypothetical protein